METELFIAAIMFAPLEDDEYVPNVTLDDVEAQDEIDIIASDEYVFDGE